MILCSINIFQSCSFITATLHIPLHSPLGCCCCCWWWNYNFLQLYIFARLLKFSRWRHRCIRTTFYSNASCTLHMHMVRITGLKTSEEYSTDKLWPFNLSEKNICGKNITFTLDPPSAGKNITFTLDPYNLRGKSISLTLPLTHSRSRTFGCTPIHVA